MNTINPIQNNAQITQPSSLRRAAISPDLPKLTNDEDSLIQEKFTSTNLKLYTGNGKTQISDFSMGRNIDTRI